MREIKFRAWDMVIGKMIVWEDLLNKHKLNEILKYGYDLELMQYTGLKDKNGVDIYEGDILLEKNCKIWEEYTNDDGEKWSKMTGKTEDRLYTVYYNEKTCHFTTNRVWLFTINNYTEVIGNIYENPELLEVDKW